MSDDLDALVEALDNLFAMLEEEGYYTKANTADFARKAITTLRAQLAEVKAELGNANRIMDDWTTLHRVIADIRDASGLGSRPMLSDLAAEIGRSLAEANARADRAEAALAAQIEADDLPPFNFDRYINGVLMAEGVTINKETTIDSAMMVASRIASKGTNGEVPVLVYRAQPHDRTALERMLAEAREKALRDAADLADTSINKGGLVKSMAFLLRAEDYETYRKACEDYQKVILAMIDSEQQKENMQK